MTNLRKQDVVPSSPSYRSIPLTQGKVAIVDDGDFEWLNQWIWFAYFSRGVWYAARGEKNKLTRMHRAILKPRKGLVCDHRNGNGLDNRRQNLRAIKQANNTRNRRCCGGVSGIHGVYPSFLPKKPWRARITVRGKRISLGCFSSKEKAKAARKAAEHKHYGEFRRIDDNPVQITCPSPLPRRSLQKRNKSGYRNISWDAINGKWLVMMWDGKKSVNRGRFVDIGDAIKARDSFKSRHNNLQT
jgi:hypothetical protein